MYVGTLSGVGVVLGLSVNWNDGIAVGGSVGAFVGITVGTLLALD